MSSINQLINAINAEKRRKRQESSYRLKKLKEEIQYIKLTTGKTPTPKEVKIILKKFDLEEEKNAQNEKKIWNIFLFVFLFLIIIGGLITTIIFFIF